MGWRSGETTPGNINTGVDTMDKCLGQRKQRITQAINALGQEGLEDHLIAILALLTLGNLNPEAVGEVEQILEHIEQKDTGEIRSHNSGTK